MDGSELFEGFAGQRVLLVEVGGDDEEAFFVEALAGVVEDCGGDGPVDSVVLVKLEGYVWGAEFLPDVEYYDASVP